MAFQFSPKIVTDGLVLYLDAANTKSYPGSGTTWSDISRGGNNGTLVNGPTFSSANGGSIVFDGVNDYVNIPYTTNLTPSLISFNMWALKSNWTSSPANQKLFSKTQIGGYALGCAVFTVNQLEFLMYLDGNYRYAVYPLASLSTGWKNIQGSFDGRYIRLYINGTLVNTYDNTTNTTISYSINTQFIIGAEPGSDVTIDGNYFNGTISSVQIYNRALSAQEVLQNYNATKSRYNLT